MKYIKSLLRNIFRMCASFLRWYKALYVGRKWYVKTMAFVSTLVVLFFLYLGAVDVNLFWLFGRSPGWKDISEHKTNEASELYSADGVLLGKYFNQNRTPVKYEDVNPVFWKALIDTEDERYYDHWGIDPLGLLGAAKDAVTGKGGRGASTITQQLAKNMFRVRTKYSTGLMGKIPGVKILIMKTKEWITAIKFEIYFSYTKGRKEGKKEILTQYANTVDFGHNAYGIKTAARTYFNTTPDKLSPDQCAILVGMLKATTFYNPISHPDNCIKRRNVVLDNMRTHGDLTEEEFAELKEKSIDVSEFKVEENYDGQAKYFREAIAKYLSSWCEETGNDLYTSGLKIYTTIDSKMQKYAEDAAIKQMRQVQRNFRNHWGNVNPWQDENHKEIEGFIEDIAKKQSVYKHLQALFPNQPDSVTYYLNKPHKVKVFDYDKGEIEMEMSTMDSIRYMVRFMHCAFVAMEPETGHVKAWVGDIDFNHWKYDKVTAQRQPGSTFKLFVYTEAMEQGLTPCDKRRDEYFSMHVWDAVQKKDVVWAPTNANGYFSNDSMPLRAAFARSINSVAVRLGQEMGIKNIIETAHAMGIRSKLDDAPSLALGSSDVNLLELANAYSTVANNGKAHSEAILVTKILDRDGKEIYVAPTEQKQAISLKAAYLMQKMLQAGMRDAGGTSQSLWGYVGDFRDTEFGGKTGTSNNHSDAWFMGVSPHLVVGAWVGGEYRCIHFRTGALGQGSRTALPICGYFLQSVLSDPKYSKYRGKFMRPNGIDVDLSMYECQYVGTRRDTADVDSLDTVESLILIDENGNPIDGDIQSAPILEKPEEKEEEVTLDNL